MIEILHRYTRAVIYKSEVAETVAKAVIEAATRYADLRYANLQCADLQCADLRCADLRYANLQCADLRCADLQCADLQYADLQYADLRCADLQCADLECADLQYADLRCADLRCADLECATNIPLLASAQTVLTPEGDLIGWKKCQGGIVVKLRIPADAQRSNATGRQCRAEFVDVLEVIGSDVGISLHDSTITYVAGERVACREWCEDRWQECGGGIHFFITEVEAQEY